MAGTSFPNLLIYWEKVHLSRGKGGKKRTKKGSLPLRQTPEKERMEEGKGGKRNHIEGEQPHCLSSRRGGEKKREAI